ncbi:MAG: hypothetical protein FJ316_05625 [SAR202 cluster bacterium]|nr:hypothetical protein [SAR202 cluster bacterium]
MPTQPQQSLVFLDPRDENAKPAALASRPASLDGKVIGLFSNNKPHSETMLRMIADLIGERYAIKGVLEHNKGGHQWPANKEALQEMAGKCDVAIHATAE